MYQLCSNGPNTHENSPLCGTSNVVKRKRMMLKSRMRKKRKRRKERDHSSRRCCWDISGVRKWMNNETNKILNPQLLCFYVPYRVNVSSWELPLHVAAKISHYLVNYRHLSHKYHVPNSLNIMHLKDHIQLTASSVSIHHFRILRQYFRPDSLCLTAVPVPIKL